MTKPTQIALYATLSDELNRAWESFSHLAESVSAHYIRIRNLGTFPDTLFADYAHLNACGAKKATDELISRIAAIGGLDLSLTSTDEQKQ